eukprot:TRINITY_DN22944_c0_g1_i1.p1 TRINITY_DN22944_c0_g1~~TRINITY_DN22944_c0_g1_i1.p1  ORF type:complete len:777 (-),score=226.15 TRINITY_DN22944_c0_g1_i1:12-2342(-)
MEVQLVEVVERIIRAAEDEEEDQEFYEAVDLFLYNYCREQGRALTKVEERALKEEAFLNVWNAKIWKNFGSEMFLEGLLLLSSIENLEVDLLNSGAVGRSLHILATESNLPNNQILVFKILSNLSTHPGIRNWIGKVNGISKVLESLNKYSQVYFNSIHQNQHVTKESIGIIESCLKCISNLSYRDKQNKHIIVRLKGIDTILSIRKEKMTPRLANLSLVALRNLASSEDVMKLQQHILVREILLMINEFKFPMIQVNAIWTLINLMTGRENLKDFLIEQGAIKNILESMETHLLVQEVQLAAATALSLLTKRNLARKEMWSVGKFSVLFSTIQEHRYHIPIQRACIKLLFRLCFYKPIRETIGKEIILETLQTMDQHPDSLPIQRSGVICLLVFTKHPGPLKEFLQNNALVTVVPILKRFHDSPRVCVVAQKLLDEIVTGNEGLIREEDAKKSVDLLRIELGQLKSMLQERNKSIVEIQNLNDSLMAKNEKLENRVSTLGVKYKEARKAKLKAESKLAKVEGNEVEQSPPNPSFLATVIAKERAKSSRNLLRPDNSQSLESESSKKPMEASRRNTTSFTIDTKNRSYDQTEKSSESETLSPRSMNAKRLLLQKTHHDNEKIAIAKNLYQEDEKKDPLKKISSSEKLRKSDNPKSPRKASKSFTDSQDPTREIVFLNHEIMNLRRTINLLQLQFLNEKKEKEHLQEMLKRTRKTANNSQSLIIQLQKESVQGFHQEKKPKQATKSATDYKKRANKLQKENAELKKIIQQLKQQNDK